MKVFLTGAFGTIGVQTLRFLCEKGHPVRCLDLPTRQNRRKYRNLSRRYPLEVIWGDICDPSVVGMALNGIDAVIHLAGLIPPASERNPEAAYQVNVEGTRGLLQAAKKQKTPPSVLFTSSYTTCGPANPADPLQTPFTPQAPNNHYTRHKVQCEEMLLESGLRWNIVRLSLVMDPAKIAQLDPEMFEIPLDQRIELLHPEDAGRALAAIVDTDVCEQVLMLGGGGDWQITYREMLSGFMPLFGLRLPPETAFRTPSNPGDWYYTNWMDTAESQRLLQFQTISFASFLEECRRKNGWLGLLARPFRGVIEYFLLRMSDYYAVSREKATFQNA
ncbi:MAG: NAD(P)-dependent oxidoreductase [Lewinellaceae bacterium]|nr:NAD(P)-dependent oxidoreductase [Lewinellaceae bacterium]